MGVRGIKLREGDEVGRRHARVAQLVLREDLVGAAHARGHPRAGRSRNQSQPPRRTRKRLTTRRPKP